MINPVFDVASAPRAQSASQSPEPLLPHEWPLFRPEWRAAVLADEPAAPGAEPLPAVSPPAPAPSAPASRAALEVNAGQSVSTVPLSEQPLISSLLLGVKWGSATPGEGVTLTYSFRTPQTVGIKPGVTQYADQAWYLSDADKAAVRSALAKWAAVANIQFVEVPETASSQGDLRFGGTRGLLPTLIAETQLPINPVDSESGDVWLGTAVLNEATTSGIKPGSLSYMSLIHEIGHALGLKHPQDPYGHYHLLPLPYDTQRITTMSYNLKLQTLPSAPQALDIAAMQYLYGANLATNAGDTVHRFSPTEPAINALWDPTGNNSIDASNQTRGVKLNLFAFDRSSIGGNNVDANSGTPVASNNFLTLAPGTRINDAIGSGFDDVIVGNPGDNEFEGGGGFDTLRGGLGTDTAIYRLGVPAASVKVEADAAGRAVTHVKTLDGRGLLDYWYGPDGALYVADVRRAQDIPPGQVNLGIDRLENIEHIGLG